MATTTATSTAQRRGETKDEYDPDLPKLDTDPTTGATNINTVKSALRDWMITQGMSFLLSKDSSQRVSTVECINTSLRQRLITAKSVHDAVMFIANNQPDAYPFRADEIPRPTDVYNDTDINADNVSSSDDKSTDIYKSPTALEAPKTPTTCTSLHHFKENFQHP